MAYTTSDLLSIIKKKAFLPSTQSTFTDDDLLELATDEMRDNIVPIIMKTRGEYYLVFEDFTFGGTTPYIRIPSRAIGGALREVTLLQGDEEYNIALKTIEDKPYQVNRGYTDGFYLQGNKIYPISGQSGTLRVYYFIRPSALVQTSASTQVVSIDRDTGVITTSAIPSAWGSSNTIDFLEELSGFDILGSDVSCTIGSSQITVAPADIPTELVAGSWISLRDTSPVPQIPVELFAYLAQAVVVQILDSVGDFEAKASAEAKLEKIEKNALSTLSPRVEGAAKTFVPQANKGKFYNRWR